MLALEYDGPSIYQFGMGVLTKFRIAAGLKQHQLAKLAGTSQPQIQRLEKGTRGLKREWAIKIAPHVGATPEQLMFGDRTVALIGYVGASSTAHYYADSDTDLGRAKMPPGGTETTVAVRVRGDSLGGPFDGWVIYYDSRRAPPTDDLLGELCVVGLASGQVLVKQLMRGRAEGRYDLFAVNSGPLTDQEIVWAALVTAILPPREALVEESQEPPSVEILPAPKKKKKPTATRRKK